MSQAISPSSGKPYGLKRVCEIWDIARSTIYASRNRSCPASKRGPKPSVEEDRLLNMIQEDIKSSAFKGEGHRKVHAALRKKMSR